MSAITRIGDLGDEIADPGVVTSIQKHVSDGCPLAPLVECVTPDYDPEDRARVMAAMVDRAKALIVHQNEHAANDHAAQLPDTMSGKSEKPKRGRPRSIDKAARDMVADAEDVTERTIRRRLEPPPAEPVAPPPAKPVPIEKLILEYAAKVQALAEEGEALLPKALADIPMEPIEDSRGVWGPGKPRGGEWRIWLRACVGELSRMPSRLGTVSDEIKRGRAALASLDYKAGQAAKAAREKKASVGDRIASGGGLKRPGKQVHVVDENDQPLLPTVQETADAWADAAKVGVGPSDDEDAF